MDPHLDPAASPAPDDTPDPQWFDLLVGVLIGLMILAGGVLALVPADRMAPAARTAGVIVVLLGLAGGALATYRHARRRGEPFGRALARTAAAPFRIAFAFLP